jgi:hypothetical protein
LAERIRWAFWTTEDLHQVSSASSVVVRLDRGLRTPLTQSAEILCWGMVRPTAVPRALVTSPTHPRGESHREILGEQLREGSIYRLLADEGDRLFPNDSFGDLSTPSVRGRSTVPARVLATVMLLQAFAGLSDREAIDQVEVDLHWRVAYGVDTGAEALHPTALVGQRHRLRASSRPTAALRRREGEHTFSASR